MESRFVETNGITIHYLEHSGNDPTLLLLPGLTANAHSFGGLVDAGLSPTVRVLAVDLRGRGLSDHPKGAYSIADHARDVIGLMDGLDLDRVVLGGHSFGGMLTYYLAATYPDRFSALVTIDAPAEVDPVVVAQIKPSLDRLGIPVASWDEYLAAVKAQPYFGDWWDPKIEDYYRADVKDNPDGTVQSRSRADDMQAAIDGTLEIDWPEVVGRVNQPTLAIRATDAYGPPGSPPILPKDKADRVVELLSDPYPAQIEGNHLTILFGTRARTMVSLITEFVAHHA